VLVVGLGGSGVGWAGAAVVVVGFTSGVLVG
jgi:hypothetical protein